MIRRRAPLKRSKPPRKVSPERARRWARCKRLIRKRSGGRCEAIIVFASDCVERCQAPSVDGAHYPYNRRQCSNAWDLPDCVLDTCREHHDILDGRAKQPSLYTVRGPKDCKDRAFEAILEASKEKPRGRAA